MKLIKWIKICLKARELSKKFSSPLVHVKVRIVEKEENGFYHHYISQTRVWTKPGVELLNPCTVKYSLAHYENECPHPDCIVRKVMES